MRKTIESSWDYYRKLNLIIASIVTLGITIGFIIFEKPILTFIIISSLFICFLTFLLFLRKSIFIENDKISGFHTFLGI
ncbi:hypothetical protein, partial [Flavobacterium sp.]|uniref:hypothetical protein n=1 Tax=Flavobacterium sp. TaxID=239 RepID=UPI0035284335